MNFTACILMAVAGTCLAAIPTTRASEPDAPTNRPLRVVTLNVLHDGPTSGFLNNGTRLEERMELVVSELHRLDPDIVALQEASHSRRHGDVAQKVADALGLHKVFAPATEHIFSVPIIDKLIVGVMGFKEGSAILTRFPITASYVYDLPRCRSRFEPRILLRADLKTPQGPLHVFSTHTAWGDECQIERVGQIVREYEGPGHSILMGDFNAAETSKVLTILRDEAGFVDAFRAANPSELGATVWQRIHAEQQTVSRRVDFIFLTPTEGSRIAVHSSRLILDQPAHFADGTALWPSDHYGVFAEVGWETTEDPGF
ncbi:MAG: endonuclease/exonuclease/phosphatase family protein [Nitrospiraceae bacterium]